MRLQLLPVCLVFLSLAVLAGCPQPPPDPPAPPTAAFTATPLQGDAPLTVQFTDQSTPGGAAISAWSWNFGDGTSSTERNPSKIYTVAGSYNVSLTVTTTAGSDTEQKDAFVTVETPVATGVFVPGVQTFPFSETVGREGASFEGLAGTTLENISLDVPAAAIPADVQLQFGYDDGSFTPVNGTAGPVAVVIDAGGLKEFDAPVDLNFTYAPGKQAETFPIVFRINASGNLELAQVTSLDVENGSAVMQTFQPGTYLWVVAETRYDKTADKLTYNTSFDVDLHGFSITNIGSEINREGECFGMSTFALWMFQNRTSRQLFSEWQAPVAGLTTGIQQDVIATRTHDAVSYFWETFYKPLSDVATGWTDAQEATLIAIALDNMRAPLPILFYRATGGQHAVLCTGYEDRLVVADGASHIQRKFIIYDPNFPGSNDRFFSFRDDTLAWERVFSGSNEFDGAVPLGNGSIRTNEPYESIEADADTGFTGGTVRILPEFPADGALLGGAPVVIVQGTVPGGTEVVPQILRVYANQWHFDGVIADDGTYSFPVPVLPGFNWISYKALGITPDNNRLELAGTLTPTRVESSTPAAKYRIMLTWESELADIDLVVIDPTGDFSSVSEPITNDGGELVEGDRGELGPEVWVLEYSDVIRPGTYRVRAHYFAGPPNVPVRLNLYISENEGLENARLHSLTGVVNSPDPGNTTDPNFPAGIDWEDLASITL